MDEILLAQVSNSSRQILLPNCTDHHDENESDEKFSAASAINSSLPLHCVNSTRQLSYVSPMLLDSVSFQTLRVLNLTQAHLVTRLKRSIGEEKQKRNRIESKS